MSGVRFPIELPGLVKSIQGLDKLSKKFVEQDKAMRAANIAYKARNTAARELLRTSKAESTQIKTTLHGIYSSKNAIATLTNARQQQILSIRKLVAAQRKARGGLDLAGTKKSLAAIRQIKSEITNLSSVFKGNKTAQVEYINELKRMGGAYAVAVKGVKNTHQLYSRVGKLEKNLTTTISVELDRRIAKAKAANNKLRVLALEQTRDMMKNIASGVGRTGGSDRNAGLGLADPKSGFKAFTNSQRERIRLAEQVKKNNAEVANSIKKNNAEVANSIKRVVARTIEQTEKIKAGISARRTSNAIIGKLGSKLKLVANITAVAAARTREFTKTIRDSAVASARSVASTAKRLKNHTKLIYSIRKMNNAMREAIRMNKLYDKGRLTGAGKSKKIDQMTRSVRRLNGAMRGGRAGYNTWWKRFGAIAVGFAIAYRAIYAFQQGVMALSRMFVSGLKVMDDYVEGLNIISGMVATIYVGGSWQARFFAANELMAGTMENMIRLAPKYRLGMEEVTAGLRELAQFGVVVKKEDSEKTLNTIAMIKEIASYSSGEGGAGGGIKQIRQEIQALFTGSARITDQFSRMIKNTMPDLWRQMTDMTISAADRWKILNERVWDFSAAVRMANQTVRNQFQIAKKSLEIISKQAIFESGIFDSWVLALNKFNRALFDAKGNLLPLGEKFKEIFADMWTSVDHMVNAFLAFGSAMYVAYSNLKAFLSPWAEIIRSVARTAALIFVIRTGLQMTVSLLAGLGAAAGLKGLMRLLLLDISASGFVAGLGVLNTGLKTLLFRLVMIPAALVGAFSIGLILGREFYISFAGSLNAVKDAWINLDGFFIAHFNSIKADLELIAFEIFGIFDKITGNWTPEKMFFGQKLLNDALEAKEKLNKVEVFDFAKTGLERWAEAEETWNKAFTNLTDSVLSGAGDIIKPWTDSLVNGVKDAVDGVMKALNLDVGSDLGKQLRKAYQEFMLAVGGDGKINLYTKENFPDPRGDFSFSLGEPPKHDGKSSKQGKKTFTDQYTKDLQNYRIKALDLTKLLGSDLSTVWSDVFEGNITKLSDLWDGMMDSMLSSFQKAMTNMVDIYVQELLVAVMKGTGASSTHTGASFLPQMISGVFNWASGLSAGQDPSSMRGVGAQISSFASGGIIPEHVVGVGMSSGRQYEFGENGPERVLSNSESFSAPSMSVAVNVINKTGTDVTAQQGKVRFDGEQFVVDVIMTRLATDPGFRANMRG